MLAIGIVVDDAIVVVENVERNIHEGLSPHDATIKAMSEVTSPIIAITLVLCAVFVPIAFISGLTGQFYRQFALTIAFSTVISAFNSLTLSPALAAILLQGKHDKKDGLSRLIEKLFGPFFRGFNRVFERSSAGYGRGVGGIVGRKAVALALYAVLLAATYFAFQKVPPGFVPVQDKAYLVCFAQLPDGANLERTEKVIREMTDIALKEPGVRNSVAFPGLSINGFINSPSAGIAFLGLKPFEERRSADLTGAAIAQKLQAKFNGVKGAFVAVFPPPPVQGLGTIGGFKLQVEDRADLGYAALDAAMKQVAAKAAQAPALAGVFTSYQINTPQVFADLDRTKAQQLGVSAQDVFDTMQIYLGSYYINDFNKFGRTYQVIAQADKQFRSVPDDILKLKIRNAAGDDGAAGRDGAPERFHRARKARCATTPTAPPTSTAGPRPVIPTGQAQAAIVRILKETLAQGHGLRVDRTDVPADHRREHGAARLPDLRAAGLSGPGGEIRKPVPAAGGDPDRAAVPAFRDWWRVDHQGRQQHLHADRLLRAGRAGVQERDPHRGVRPRTGNGWPGNRRGSHRGGASAAAPDSR